MLTGSTVRIPRPHPFHGYEGTLLAAEGDGLKWVVLVERGRAQAVVIGVGALELVGLPKTAGMAA
jgi:hypothetical protein